MKYILFKSWSNHCLRGRGRKIAHKRRHKEEEGVDDRAVTTYSIDYMDLTEEDDAEERHGGSGTARGSTTLAQPIIVVVDRKTGATRQWRHLDCDKNCSRHGRDGIRGIDIVPEGRQRVGLAGVQRQVIAARSEETLPMNSLVGESQSNGRVANAVPGVQGLIRTLQEALERRLTTKLSHTT